MRSLELRLRDRDAALRAALEEAAADPESCDTQLALALLYVSGPEPDFERGGLRLAEARRLPPQDPVLAVGVYFVFLDALLSMEDTGEEMRYDFKSTPLRDAADRLLSGRLDEAEAGFRGVSESGREVVGLIGQTAVLWARGQRDKARLNARILLAEGVLPDEWMRGAVARFT